MDKYILLSNNRELEDRYLSIFGAAIRLNRLYERLGDEDGIDLILVDDSLLPIREYLSEPGLLQKWRTPIIYIVDNLTNDGLKLLDNGVLSIILKSASADEIREKVEKISYNYKYFEKIENISKKSEKTDRFFELFNSITSENTIQETMLSILGSIRETFGFRSISFFMVSKNRLKFKIDVGDSEPDHSGKQWPVGKQRPKWLDSVSRMEAPFVVEQRQKILINLFGEQAVLMPLRIKNKFIGLITARSLDMQSPLDPYDFKLLKAYCDQTSVVLENAQLYWSVITARESLIQQEKKNLLGQMIVSLKHEINNPLSIISMEAQLLQKKLETKELKIEKRIANIESNIDRIKMILEKIASLNTSRELGIEYLKGTQMLNLDMDN